MSDDEERKSPRRSPWSYFGLGFELVLPILAGVWLGHRLDARWGTEPWLVVAGSLLGMTLGFYTFLRSVLSTKEGDR